MMKTTECTLKMWGRQVWRMVISCVAWWRRLPRGQKIAICGIAIPSLIGVLSLLLQMRKEPTIVVVNENHDACWGGMTNFVLSVMNEGRMSSLAMTNVVHDEGQGRFEGLVDFGATNASRKATSKKVVQISSDVIHTRGGAVVEDLMLPRPPTNALVRFYPEGSFTGEVFSVHYPTKMERHVQSAYRFYRLHAFSNAVHEAGLAWGVYCELIGEAKGSPMKIDPELLAGTLRIIPILIDEAMAKEDYDKMERLAEQYDEYCAKPSMYAKAIRSIVNLKRVGGQLIFFSHEQLRELRQLAPTDLLEFLNILAIKGFIQPIELEATRRAYHHVSYESFFGLSSSIQYVKSMRGVAKDPDGKELLSNHVTGQWAGMGRVVNVDIGVAASMALGLPEDQREEFPLAIDVEFKDQPWGLEPTGRVYFKRKERNRRFSDYLREILTDERPDEIHCD